MDAQLKSLTGRLRDAFHEGRARELLDELAGVSGAKRVQLLIALFNEGEFEIVASIWAPGAVHDVHGIGMPDMGTYEGPEGYAEFLRQWGEAFAETRVELLEAESVDDGDRSAWIFMAHQGARGGGSGANVAFDYAGVGESRGGLVVRSFFDRDLDRAREIYEGLRAEAGDGARVDRIEPAS